MPRFLLTALCLSAFSSAAVADESHDAGYNWADNRGIDDPDDCYSSQPGRWAGDYINNSRSFTEGCLEYLKDEGVTDEDDELDDEDDDYSRGLRTSCGAACRHVVVY